MLRPITLLCFSFICLVLNAQEIQRSTLPSSTEKRHESLLEKQALQVKYQQDHAKFNQLGASQTNEELKVKKVVNKDDLQEKINYLRELNCCEEEILLLTNELNSLN